MGSVLRRMQDVLAEAWGEIWRRRLQTLLVVGAVTVGAAGVSLIAGVYQAIWIHDSQAPGANWLRVAVPSDSYARPLRLRREALLLDDAEAIRRYCPSVDRVIVTGGHGVHDAKVGRVALKVYVGSTSAQTENEFLLPGESEKLSWGRLFTAGELAGTARVVILDAKTKAKLFGGGTFEGGSVRIDGVQFTVVGVQSPRPIEQGMDTSIVPYTTARDVFHEAYWSIFVRPERSARKQVTQTVDRIMGERLGEPGASYTDTVNALFARDNRRLFSFVGVLSILVLLSAGVALSNKVFVDVVERLDEIALRRALGASVWRVRGVILAEGALVCALGSILGGSLGWLTISMLSRKDSSVGGALHLPILPACAVMASILTIGVGSALYASSIGTSAQPSEWLGRKDVA